SQNEQSFSESPSSVQPESKKKDSSFSEALRVKEQDISKTAFRTRYGHYEFLGMALSVGLMLPVVVLWIDVTFEVVCGSFLSESSGYRSEFLCHYCICKMASFGSKRLKLHQMAGEPTTVTTVRTFSGLAGLITDRFVEGFSRLALTLTSADENRKGEKFVWTMSVRESFEELNEDCRKSGMIACFDSIILHDLERLDVELCVRGSGGYWASMRIESNLMLQIKEAQKGTRWKWDEIAMDFVMISKVLPSRFWKGLQKLGTLIFQFSKHFISNRLVSHERTIQYVRRLLRACALEWRLTWDGIFIQPDMSLSEEPESILDRQERVMRNKVIPFVKILWKNHPEREATWETEESMRASYSHFSLSSTVTGYSDLIVTVETEPLLFSAMKVNGPLL
ncbi:hypothetical protein Tco_0958214, partial [Tanacetum coccineum]